MISTGPEVTRKNCQSKPEPSNDKIMLIIELTWRFVVELNFHMDEPETFRNFD